MFFSHFPISYPNSSNSLHIIIIFFITMPPKMIKPRGRKSTEVSSTSGVPQMIFSALSILHPSSSIVFNEFFKNRIVMKHNWGIAQRLGSFLSCKDDYHDDFIRAFYAGLESFKGCTFKVCLGTNWYKFDMGDWMIVFSIDLRSSVLHPFHDEKCAPSFSTRLYLQSILKHERHVEPTERITNGMIKSVSRILH